MTIAVSLLYTVIILLFLVGLLIAMRHQPVKEVSPNITGISVVVAFRDEVDNLPILLSALQKQTLEHTCWEVIFVDDGSVDNGAELIPDCINYRCVRHNEPSGKKHAIIKGVSLSKYNLIALTDADCEPVPTWLHHLYYAAGANAFIQGSVIVETKSAIGYFEALDYASLMASSVGSFGLNCPIIASASNMAFRKDLLEVSESTLNTNFASGDDMFLLHFAKRMKLPMLFLNDNRANVKTHFDGGFLHMLQRRERWASKASGYTDFQTILVALVVFCFNLCIVLYFLLAICGIKPFMYSIYLWLLKCVVDFVLLSVYLYLKCSLKLLLVYLPLQAIYPFYTVYVAARGLLGSVKWK